MTDVQRRSANPEAPLRGLSPLERTARVDRLGRFVFALVYVTLLSGQISPDRFAAGVGTFELRLPLTFVSLLLYVVWLLGQPRAERQPYYSRFIAFFFVFMLYQVASALWSPIYSNLTSALQDVTYLFLLVFMALDAARRRPALLDDLIKYILGTGVVYALAAFLQGAGDQGRYSALGGGPNVFVRVVSIGFLAAVIIAVRSQRMRYLLVAPILVAGALLSGSRGGLVALAAVTILLVLPYLIRVGSVAIARIVLLLLIVAGAVWAAVGSTIQTLVSTRLIDQSLEQGYTAGRTPLYEVSVTLFREHPIFGGGLNSFYGFYGRVAGFDYPHNFALQLAAEGGVVGIVLFVLVAMSAVVSYLRNRDRVLGRAFWWMFIYMFVASMFSGGLYDTRFMWLFLGLITIATGPAAYSVPPSQAQPDTSTRSLSRVRPSVSARQTPVAKKRR